MNIPSATYMLSKIAANTQQTKQYTARDHKAMMESDSVKEQQVA